MKVTSVILLTIITQELQFLTKVMTTQTYESPDFLGSVLDYNYNVLLLMQCLNFFQFVNWLPTREDRIVS